jgi:hypothetical protein
MDISKELYINHIKVDSFELAAILGNEFNGQSHNLNNGNSAKHEVVYGDNEITVTYKSDSRKIRKIEAGKNLSSEKKKLIISNIVEYLINQKGEYEYPTTILFATNNVEFRYKFSELFQVFNAPIECPRPDSEIGYHPLILQYKTLKTGIINLDGLRRSKSINEAQLLLASLSPTILGFSIRNPNLYQKKVWVNPPVEIFESPEKYESMYLWLGYHWGQTISSEKFATIDLSIESMSCSILDDYFRIYYSLNVDDQNKILRGCLWYHRALIANNLTEMFLNFVIMIESFLPKGERCKKCSGYIPSSKIKCCKCGQFETEIGRNFREFVKKHAGVENEAFIKSIYKTRSEIAHSAMTISGEGYGYSAGIIPKDHNENNMIMTLQRTCSLIIQSVLTEMNKKNTFPVPSLPHSKIKNS